MAPRRPPALCDRLHERGALDRLLECGRRGQSGVVVIRGEAGVGKTALLRYAAHQASGFGLAEIAGVEAEMELPFAALHQLCGSRFSFPADEVPGRHLMVLSRRTGWSRPFRDESSHVLRRSLPR